MAQLKDLIVNGNARIITDLNVNGYETVDETVKVGRDPTANLEVATKQYVDNHSGGGSYNAEGQDPEDVFAAYQSGQSVYYDITSTNYSSLDGGTLNGEVPTLFQQPQFYGRYYLTEVPYETFNSGNDTGWYIFTKAGYTKSEYINSDTKIRLYNYSLELYDDYGQFNQAYLYGGYSEAGDNKGKSGSTDTSSKIYLVGATSQAADVTTYSDNQVYATDGQLDANKVRIAETGTIQYNSTDQAIEFVFA